MPTSRPILITVGVFTLFLAGCSNPQPEGQAPLSNAQPQDQAPRSNPQAEIRAALASVCSGGGVAEAAAYAGGALHPVILLRSSGEVHDWSDDLSGSWVPQSIQNAQLVACVDPEQEREIEVCAYDGPDITRYRYEESLRLVGARTGATVASTVLEGNDPRECQQTEPYDLTRLAGDPVSFAAAEDWLRAYVEGSADAGEPQAEQAVEPPPSANAQPPVEVSVYCASFGESPVILESGREVVFLWKWGAASDDYLNVYVDAASFALRMDAELVDISDTSPTFHDCEDVRCATWRLPAMALDPGAHQAQMTVTLSREISDGFDLNQDGALDTYGGVWEAPVCEIIVE